MPAEENSDEVGIPVLLRFARNTFISAIQQAQAQAGCEDMPRNGTYVIGSIARVGSPLSQIIKELGVSKQAAGQLVDTLVARGYLDRTPDPEDRRRLTITLTERGRHAAEASQAAVAKVEADLLAEVGPECVANTRATLWALIDAGGEHRR